MQLRLAGWHVSRHGKMICRERLSLRGRDQPVDWDRPPNIPDIWSRRCGVVSAVLRSNVDSVIAQVSSVGVTCFRQQPQCYGLHRHKQAFMHVLQCLVLFLTQPLVLIAGECIYCCAWHSIWDDQQHPVELGICHGWQEPHADFTAASI